MIRYHGRMSMARCETITDLAYRVENKQDRKGFALIQDTKGKIGQLSRLRFRFLHSRTSRVTSGGGSD